MLLGGARCKRQRLRHSIDEIAQCHHINSESEWHPQQHGKERWYPSAEEAEYTAPLVFAIAVSVSWWAARVGKAISLLFPVCLCQVAWGAGRHGCRLTHDF